MDRYKDVVNGWAKLNQTDPGGKDTRVVLEHHCPPRAGPDGKHRQAGQLHPRQDQAGGQAAAKSIIKGGEGPTACDGSA